MHACLRPTRAGRLEPGERVVARFALSAGLVPVLLEGEVRCRVAVDEDAVLAALEGAQAAASAAAAAAGVDITDTGARGPAGSDRSQAHLPLEP
jgi:hypothetical protein